MTKLASSLPGGDANGLTAIARQLIDTPHNVHVVIGLVDCSRSARCGRCESAVVIGLAGNLAQEQRGSALVLLDRLIEARS